MKIPLAPTESGETEEQGWECPNCGIEIGSDSCPECGMPYDCAPEAIEESEEEQ